MAKRSLRLVFAISLLVSLMISAAPAGAEQVHPENQPAASVVVTLKCKIIGNADNPPGTSWIVGLRTAGAVQVKRARGIAGDTIQFKKVPPGIYMVCLTGDDGSRSCESIDMIPAPGKQSAEYSMTVRAPRTSGQGTNTNQVSLGTLKIPGKARSELKLYEKESLAGNREAMLLHLSRAIEIYPGYAEAWNNLGTYHHRNGNAEESIRCFTKVTELNPNLYLGWMNLGASLLAVERFEDGIAANLEALRLCPNDTVATAQIGLGYYYMRQYTAAKKYLQRVVVMDPAYANSPQLFLAHIALAESNRNEAIEYLRSFLSYHPNAPQAARSRQLLQGLVDGSILLEEPKKR